MSPSEDAVALIGELTERRLTIAVAESLTGGMLTAALVDVPGASLVVNGGVVAYATPLKHSLLGVDAELLAERGAVDPDVACQMADGVRSACAVDGRAADLGLATTGAAGPDPQDGREPGTVYLGVASGRGIRSVALQLSGDRPAVRRAAVAEAISAARDELAQLSGRAE
ncbi:CinA family protein [Agromyces sp. Marseille-P2726]|uniref:CinA family protein n=1 Tax=Agromyces sp. Marseille-P2726 TaxID=2709132 RepID=UPI00157093A9|nr:nicotinamide-nucleotide amidohydrolase family protein [Agromyces sp. Marseille-P2726]